MKAPLPENESARLEALHRYAILDSLSEPAYDDLAVIAAEICGTPISLVSLVDKERQWFKAKVGIEAIQTPRDIAFCAHAILGQELFVVSDAQADTRFAENPLVTEEPKIRFYAGAPLINPAGLALGTLCVIDRMPRSLEEKQKDALMALSRQVVTQLELRRNVTELERAMAEMQQYQRKLESYQKKLEEMNIQLEQSSHVDGLTGLNNRRSLELRLEEEYSRAARYGKDFSVLMVDVDHFKKLNDTFGHMAGDSVLRKVAQTIQEASRNTDYTARYGGEEFAVILPHTGEEGAFIIAERIRKAVQNMRWEQGHVTVSIGTATWRSKEMSGADLIKEADKALYRAKETGRNRVSQAADCVGEEEKRNSPVKTSR